MHNNFVDKSLSETTEHLLRAMLEVLHDSGFRITNQRKIILEAVAHQVGWHVHPKDVYSYAKEKDDSIGLATVYRTLKMLEDMDLLNKVYMMGTQDHNQSHHGAHYHLVCLKCGNIKDVKDDTLEEMSKKMQKEHGFTTTHTKLSLYGLCEDCKE